MAGMSSARATGMFAGIAFLIIRLCSAGEVVDISPSRERADSTVESDAARFARGFGRSNAAALGGNLATKAGSDAVDIAARNRTTMAQAVSQMRGLEERKGRERERGPKRGTERGWVANKRNGSTGLGSGLLAANRGRAGGRGGANKKGGSEGAGAGIMAVRLGGGREGVNKRRNGSAGSGVGDIAAGNTRGEGGGANKRTGSATNNKSYRQNARGKISSKNNGSDQNDSPNSNSISNSNKKRPKNGNRHSSNGQNKNGPNRKGDIIANGMAANSEKNKPQCKKRTDKNSLSGRLGCESIAETMARTSLDLRPEVDNKTMRKKKSQLVGRDSSSGGGGSKHRFPHRYPKIRFVRWDQLTDDTKKIVKKSLKYDEESWNYSSHNAVESKTFSQLTEGQRNSALMLGIDQNVWDCFINHYSSYGRQDLVSLGLYEYATTLSDVRSKKWEQLNRSEMQAATKLCYSKEAW